jgi:surfactin synthase thioesterase subunit
MDRPAGLWVVDGGRAENSGSPSRLFCFAHAGGGPSFYRRWGAFLLPEIAVRRVLLPGRESLLEEPPFRHIADLVDPLCAALEPQLDRPYALFGHSMGAVIAYEMARRVSGAGTAGPRCLIVSGCKAPGLPANRPPLSALPDDEFVTAVARLGGMPPEVLNEPDLISALLPALRADYELAETYEPLPGGRLGCPVIAYLGTSDPDVEYTQMLDWQQVTTGEFTMRVFHGGHFYLKGARPDVLHAVREDLSQHQ